MEGPLTGTTGKRPKSAKGSAPAGGGPLAIPASRRRCAPAVGSPASLPGTRCPGAPSLLFAGHQEALSAVTHDVISQSQISHWIYLSTDRARKNQEKIEHKIIPVIRHAAHSTHAPLPIFLRFKTCLVSVSDNTAGNSSRERRNACAPIVGLRKQPRRNWQEHAALPARIAGACLQLLCYFRRTCILQGTHVCLNICVLRSGGRSSARVTLCGLLHYVALAWPGGT